jgi:tRNA pseudouridine55 synthase
VNRRGGGARQSRRPDSGVSGCVVVDKPAGCTSHDVVDQVRRALGTRKVGHAGTLDPDATGVLVLGVGAGTKLLEFVSGSDKTYLGQLRLGIETATLDASGTVTARYDMSVTPDEVASAAATFVGPIEQIPPMVSAVKVDGRRLHELAREGKEVAREPRPVTVHRFHTAPTEDPLVYELEVDCSSGTYIRTLVADLGTALGGGAHLQLLRRSAVGPFSLDDCCPVDEVVLKPVIELVRGMAVVDVDEAIASQVADGRSFGPSAGTGRLAVRGPAGDLLAIYEAAGGQFRPVKVLAGRA